jgi:hypothetical protein
MRSLGDLRRIIGAMPRPAFLGIAVLIVTGILFLLSFFLLGGARDRAQADTRRVQMDIDTAIKAIAQSKQDQEYVAANSARYEELLKSDKLVPHTRRAALSALRDAASPYGLEDALGYTFSAGNSLDAAQSQPTSGSWRVNVETISLTVAAPTDGSVYRLIDDLNHSFPGSVALESITLSRANVVNESALVQVSAGTSQLVTAEAILSWRTAQKEEAAANAKSGAASGAKP